MRRLLRRITHLLAVLALVLGLGCLIAWPVSYLLPGFGVYRLEARHWQTSTSDLVVGLPLVLLESNRGRLIFGFSRWIVEPNRKFISYAKKTASVDTSKCVWSRRFSWHLESQVPRHWFLFRVGNPLAPVSSKKPFTQQPAVHVVLPSALVGGILVLLGVIWFIGLWWVGRRKVNQLDSGLCLHCGYNLTGVQGERCPECGAVRPKVSLLSASR